jgi:TetR/AcrR family transcriptional repressor of bet genes
MLIAPLFLTIIWLNNQFINRIYNVLPFRQVIWSNNQITYYGDNMGRPSNKEQRRQQITQGLMETMALNGYDKASIQAIAKAAGLTPGLIHYHFKTKQEILVELIKNLNGKAQSRFTAQLETASTATEKLNAYIDAALALGDGADEAAVSAWVTISSEAIRQAEVREIYQSIVAENLAQLTTLLTDYTKEMTGTLDKAEIKALASMILATIEGCYQLATTANELMPRDYAAKTLKALIHSYL